MSNQEIQLIRQQADKMSDQFEAALPAHIPVERFNRVLLTAVQGNPLLAKCVPSSLWGSAMKAAQDGLLPDGREGAIVHYRDTKKNQYIAQWLPMIGGLRKKVRNSGEIATWDVHAVYENDNFEFELGDQPYIRHRPALSNRGEFIAAYSIAVLKSGEISRDVMGKDEIEKIKSKSKAKNGPWADPIFYPEMAKKTVAKRHSKVLPMSTDLDDLMRRDEALYDLESASDAAPNRAKPGGLAGKMGALAGMDDGAAGDGDQGEDQAPDTGDDITDIDPETGEIIGDKDDDQGPAPDPDGDTVDIPEKAAAEKPTENPAPEGKGDPKADAPAPEEKPAAKAADEYPADQDSTGPRYGGIPDDWLDISKFDEAQVEAHDAGVANHSRGMARDVVPRSYNDGGKLLAAYQLGWDNWDA